jgi:hypothetical protein
MGRSRRSGNFPAVNRQQEHRMDGEGGGSGNTLEREISVGTESQTNRIRNANGGDRRIDRPATGTRGWRRVGGAVARAVIQTALYSALTRAYDIHAAFGQPAHAAFESLSGFAGAQQPARVQPRAWEFSPPYHAPDLSPDSARAVDELYEQLMRGHRGDPVR